MSPTESQEWLWQNWAILAEQYGWPEGKCRKLIGGWIKRHGSQLTRRALIGIREKRPVEPISWAEAGFKKIHAANAWKHRPGYKPNTSLPPEVPLDQRVKPERLAQLRRELMGTE